MLQAKEYKKKRLNIQAELDGKRSQDERNRMGQFATPPALSQDIIQHAKKLLSRGKIQFLDPAFGTGSFYSALLSIFPTRQIIDSVGFEIDFAYGEAARQLWKKTPLKLHLQDFTKVESPANDDEKFNLIICNPPYVRHHHIANEEKAVLQHKTKSVCGYRIPGLAGLYCYFLCLSHGWMKSKGLAGWLIPSEFMDVNYGKAVKQYLLEKVTLLQIHRFDPNQVQFEDALVSSAIVWFCNQKPPERHEVMFSYGGTLEKPYISKHIPVEVLLQEPKWTRFPLSEVREVNSGLTLADFFSIKRGLATGNNRFFILNREQIKARKLPMECFRPILPSSRFLKFDEVQADAEGIPLIDKQLFLLDCNLPESQIRDRYPTLWKYLMEGEEKGVSERYLCRHRAPWYSQEKRQPPLFICTYIGRNNNKIKRPFRFIINHSKATVANTYLALYPKPMLSRAISAKPYLAKKVWQFLNEISANTLLDEGRVYGGGLYKLEPNELASVPADHLQKIFGSVPNQPKQMSLFSGHGANNGIKSDA